MKQAPLIVIVGAGNIGFRHLQSLVSHPQAKGYHFAVVDPFQESLKRAENLCQEQQAQVSLYSDLEHLNSEAQPELLVSAVRASEQQQVLTQSIGLTPKKLLIEKPFMQSLKDYKFFEKLACHSKIKSYVNLSRRMWAGYRTIKENLLKERAPINIRVAGMGWGLGCNAIHFLDLFSWVTGANEIILLESKLSPSCMPNKRGKNFEEFVGVFLCKNSKGDQLQVRCEELVEDEISQRVNFSCGNLFFDIDEVTLKNIVPKGDFDFLHISQSTGLWFFSDKHDEYALPSLNEALPLQRLLLDILKSSMPDRDRFLIT